MTTNLTRRARSQQVSNHNDIFACELLPRPAILRRIKSTSPACVTPKTTDFHAAPVIPLRQRDDKELVSLFEREDAEEIAADVNSHLRCLCPEPIWDEDPFDFLREYL